MKDKIVIDEKFVLEHTPEYVKKVAEVFNIAGYRIYLVGGCVRDMLLNRKPKDWDLTTNATPDQMLALFPEGFYNNAFGTVGIPMKSLLGGETEDVVEVTTFRSDGTYSDGRHPDKVEWGKTIAEDLSRRDFTVNAMAIELTMGKEKIEALGIEVQAPPIDKTFRQQVSEILVKWSMGTRQVAIIEIVRAHEKILKEALKKK